MLYMHLYDLHKLTEFRLDKCAELSSSGCRIGMAEPGTSSLAVWESALEQSSLPSLPPFQCSLVGGFCCRSLQHGPQLLLRFTWLKLLLLRIEEQLLDSTIHFTMWYDTSTGSKNIYNSVNKLF